jgi:NAD(P)-dependent dehydrogenase (short-subunit alcohol dehydrogenase family)
MTDGKTALVTGASRGIGRAIAERLAADGYDLTISARNPAALEDAAGEMRQHGGQVAAVGADMAQEDQVGHLADAHIGRYGRLDVLVLAAGMGSGGDVESFPVRRLDKLFTVNLRSPFLLIQRLLPAMRSTAAVSGSAVKVIAIASITGVVGDPQLAAYGATKSALISLCESITAAEGRNGISATAICPGYVDTEMAAWMHDRIDPREMISVEDIAHLAAAVCRLSRHAAVPSIVVTRPGEQLWRA